MTTPMPDASKHPGATLYAMGSEFKSDGTQWVHVGPVPPGLHPVDTTTKKKYATKNVRLTFNGLPMKGFENGETVSWPTQENAVCECGAGKTGIKNYARGHSDWCPVNGES